MLSERNHPFKYGHVRPCHDDPRAFAAIALLPLPVMESWGGMKPMPCAVSWSTDRSTATALAAVGELFDRLLILLREQEFRA